MLLELVSFTVGALGLVFGASAWLLARRWSRECERTQILISRKGKLALAANLREWIAWRQAMPDRPGGDKGGVIFAANGVSVAIGVPKYGPSASSQKTTQHKDPAHEPAAQKTRNRAARRAAARASS